VAVEGLPGAAPPSRQVSAAATTRTHWLLGFTLLGWTLVATMQYWWSWLWAQVGLISVPVDTLVWILALILTILSTPILWRWFQRTGPVVLVVGSLMVGGTAIVLSPWHDVFSQAWLRMECGPGDCATPAPPETYSWRVEKPK
jgi:hypothetical protein